MMEAAAVVEEEVSRAGAPPPAALPPPSPPPVVAAVPMDAAEGEELEVEWEAADFEDHHTGGAPPLSPLAPPVGMEGVGEEASLLSAAGQGQGQGGQQQEGGGEIRRIRKKKVALGVRQAYRGVVERVVPKVFFGCLGVCICVCLCPSTTD